MGTSLLLACSPQALPALAPLLPAEARIVTASTLAQALERAGEGVDAVVCGMQFDDSRMLDLLGELRLRWPHVPVVCCRVLETHLSAVGVRAARSAAMSVGAAAFIDVEPGDRGTARAELAAALRPFLGRARFPG